MLRWEWATDRYPQRIVLLIFLFSPSTTMWSNRCSNRTSLVFLPLLQAEITSRTSWKYMASKPRRSLLSNH